MNKNLIIILVIIGAIVGVAVVKFFFLNSIQIIGWNLFWKSLSHLNFEMFKLIFKSETFKKCFIGALIGGGAGLITGFIINRR